MPNSIAVRGEIGMIGTITVSTNFHCLYHTDSVQVVPVPIHPFKVTFESMNNMVGIDGQSVNSIFVDHRYFLSPITFEELTNFAVWNYQSAQILKRYLTYLSHIKDFLLQRLPGSSEYTFVIK